MAICPNCQHDVQDGARYCSFCRSSLISPTSGADPYVGQTIHGGYFIEAKIGAGGMGTVYKGVQNRLDRPVAIKILRAALLSDPTLVQRFVREARAASQLHHPNVITVTDFGQLEGGTLFMVMEYVRGRDLLRLIREAYPLGERRVVHIGAQILAALAEAHELGIIHRDLKPENVMVESRRDDPDFVKVLDFGIAKIREPGDGSGALTTPGYVCGTPDYMSPEQAALAELDERSDLYSVGVVLYHMLARKVPFAGRSASDVLRMHMTEPPPPFSLRERDVIRVSPALEELVMRALAKKPQDRFVSALEMRDALLSCELDPELAGGYPTGSRTLVLASTPVPKPRTPPPSAPHHTPGSTSAVASDSRGVAPFRPDVPAEPATDTVHDAENSPLLPVPPATPREGIPATPHGGNPPGPPDAIPSTPRDTTLGGPNHALVMPKRRRIAWVAGATSALVVGGMAVYFGIPRPPPPPHPTGPTASQLPTVLKEPQQVSGDTAGEQAMSEGSQDEEAPSPNTGVSSRDAGEATPIVVPPSKPQSPRQKRVLVLERTDILGGLATPTTSSGQGVLAVTTAVIGKVYLDNQYVGEAPLELRLAAGKYDVRIENRSFGRDRARIDVLPGKRAVWRADPRM
jgi:serine/threonine protein kinase